MKIEKEECRSWCDEKMKKREKMSFNLFLYTIKPRVVSLFPIFFLCPPLILYGSHVVIHNFHTCNTTTQATSSYDPFSYPSLKCQKSIKKNEKDAFIVINVHP